MLSIISKSMNLRSSLDGTPCSEGTWKVPHPLSRFGHSDFKDGPHANLILKFIHDWVFQEPQSERFEAALWFLLRSEKEFYSVCSEAGIDAGLLRQHLRRSLSKKSPPQSKRHVDPITSTSSGQPVSSLLRSSEARQGFASASPRSVVRGAVRAKARAAAKAAIAIRSK